MEGKRIWTYQSYLFCVVIALLVAVWGTWWCDYHKAIDKNGYRQLEQTEMEAYPGHLQTIEDNANSIFIIYDSDSYAVKSAKYNGSVVKTKI